MTIYKEKRFIFDKEIATKADVVIENIDDYYNFRPVNQNFNYVSEGSEQHAYYDVSIRNTLLNLPKMNIQYKMLGIKPFTFKDILIGNIKNNIPYVDSNGKTWRVGDPIPNCGFTYKDKPTIHLNNEMFNLDLDLCLVNINRIMKYFTNNSIGYVIGNREEICSSCIGISDKMNIDNFIYTNKFKKITTKPMVKPVTITSAIGAFSRLRNSCEYLDLRGLMFNRNTNVENMFGDIIISDGKSAGLKELIMTDKQYKIFTFKTCKNKDNEIKKLTEQYQSDKSYICESRKSYDEKEMVSMGKKLINLEKEYKSELKEVKAREFGSYFFNGKYASIEAKVMMWEKLKKIIKIKPVEHMKNHICHSQLIKNDYKIYTYTPVDKYLKEVKENSVEHCYYSVDFSDVILMKLRENKYYTSSKVPDTGSFYRGKPVVGLSKSFEIDSLDYSLVTKHNILTYKINNILNENHIIEIGNNVNLAAVDLSNVTSLRGFLRYSQFDNIKILQPLERYKKQPILKDARYAFNVGYTCNSLDIRGLKFDKDTDVTGMFDSVSLKSESFKNFGLKELVVTPEQHALFTSQNFMLKERELERLAYNANNHKNHILNGLCIRDDETEEDAISRMDKYFKMNLTHLQFREYGSFFFKGTYDYNQWDSERWEILKKTIKIKPLGEDWN